MYVLKDSELQRLNIPFTSGTLRVYLKTGRIPSSCIFKVGKRYFFDEKKIYEWLEQQKGGSDDRRTKKIG